MAGHSKNDVFVKNLEDEGLFALIGDNNSMKSGWFDGRTFKKDEGLFALIGDNIGSHYSEEVIKVCVEKNI